MHAYLTSELANAAIKHLIASFDMHNGQSFRLWKGSVVGVGSVLGL